MAWKAIRLLMQRPIWIDANLLRNIKGQSTYSVKIACQNVYLTITNDEPLQPFFISTDGVGWYFSK